MARTPRVTLHLDCPPDFDADAFLNGIRNRLAVLAKHSERAEVVDRSPGRSGKSLTVDAAFQAAEDGQQFWRWITARLGHTGGPTGRAYWHLCSHALGEPADEPCDQAPEYVEET